MKCSVNFSLFGGGPFEYVPSLTFQKVKVKKEKRVNSFYQLSLEFMLKSLPA